MQKYLNSLKSGFIELYKDLKNKKIKKQIPNLLTLSRGTIAPIIILPFIFNDKLVIATIITALFAFTDFLDGYYARKYNVVSKFGMEVDPVCDKIFAVSLTLPLITIYPLQIIPILLLELVIAIINSVAKFINKKTKSRVIGKIKTCSLSIMIIVGYFSIYNINLIDLMENMLFATIALQIASAIEYIIAYLKEKKNITIL